MNTVTTKICMRVKYSLRYVSSTQIG